jgi:NAD(P)-dependent dehydrogenase (short-subunit alcohol dehydrogenase family)
MPTALVTGAARGIGLATTDLLLARGWHVHMLDRDGPALEAEAVKRENVTPHIRDISDAQDVNATLNAIPALDGLVNNAGVADFGPVEDTSFSRWREVMDTNLDGTFRVTQAALPALKAARGAVVNIGSISGVRASTLRVAYGTSKAALIHLTRQHAAELGEHGIRVNSVCPGPVRTKLAMAVHSKAIIAAYHDAIPLNRYGEASEIAQVITFLLSPEASYVTGQNISVDGGFEATGIGLPALRD